MVPGIGLEPIRSCDREILSLLCLPIPPPGHRAIFFRVGIGDLLSTTSKRVWRRDPESNRTRRSCSPLHSQSVIAPHQAYLIAKQFSLALKPQQKKLERVMRIELTTFSLATRCSTAELHPRLIKCYI